MGKQANTTYRTQSAAAQIYAVIYIRESSDEGVKNSNGPEIQERECREYVRALGLHVVEVLREDDVSGRIPIAERPRGAELWRMIVNGEIGAVVAARKDRFSRDEWGIELPTFLRHCTEHGVQVHAVNEGGHLRADMAGRILASFGDIMNGEERIKMAKRMWEGRRQTWENGTLIAGGVTPPFGYRRISRYEVDGRGAERVRRDFEIDPEQAAIVLECYRLLLEEKLPSRQIAVRMGRVYPVLRHPTRVMRLFKNPLYKGEFHHGDFNVLYRPDLAIVDADTFDAAQEQLKRNGIASPRSTKKEYLLRGRLTCHCGRVLHSRTERRNHKRYDCPSYQNVYAEDKHEYLSFHGSKLDDAVWQELVKVLSNRKVLHAAAREYVAAREDAIKPLQARLLSYRAELREAESETDEYINRAGRKGLSDEIIARYELKAQGAMDRAKEIRKRVAKTEAELNKMPRYDEAEIDRVADLAQKKFANGAPTFEQKWALAEWANLKGQVKEGRIEFQIEIGLGFAVNVEPREDQDPKNRNGKKGGAVDNLRTQSLLNSCAQDSQKIVLFFTIPYAAERYN